MEEPKNTITKEFLLEQYKQAFEQRARDVSLQWQLFGIGNTVLGGILFAALSSQDIMVSTILTGLAIPLCFFIYVAYRKEIYFEDLYSENIEAIEKEVGGLKHIQYDTIPHKELNTYFITRRPKKWSVERVTIHTVMTILLGMYTLASLVLFYVFGSKVISQPIMIFLVICALPFLYVITVIFDNPKRIGETFSKGQLKNK
jgi:hypothetical protein